MKRSTLTGIAHVVNMRLVGAVALAIPLAFGTSRLFAQSGPGQSGVHVPDSSIEQPGDQGLRAHTNHVISLRGGKPDAASGPSGKSPHQIRMAYGLPDANTGGSGIIAIVDAFHYPTALQDFQTFSNQFGLPTTDSLDGSSLLQVVYASGSQPRTNCGWAQESALDIQWAHAMAPNAKIVLVEAASNSFANLLQAVDVAEVLNASQISMSWGGSEFSGETSYDSFFNADLTYFAASGDTGGKTIYPGVSPLVVAAGGTRLNMSGDTVTSETGWSGSGGGRSAYESIPTFQAGIAGLAAMLNGKRGVPDFSFDADPNTGVSVYDSTRCQGMVGWMVFGGTSVSSPSLAGIVNLAAHNFGADELIQLYAGYNSASYSTNFRDITIGTAGSFSAGAGWDFVTAIGSNKGLTGK